MDPARSMTQEEMDAFPSAIEFRARPMDLLSADLVNTILILMDIARREGHTSVRVAITRTQIVPLREFLKSKNFKMNLFTGEIINENAFLYEISW